MSGRNDSEAPAGNVRGKQGAAATVVELKELLKKHNLKVSGTKQELLDRLKDNGVTVPGHKEEESSVLGTNGAPGSGSSKAAKKTAKKKKTKEETWRYSDAKKILKKALAKGEDAKGNKVLLDSKMGIGQDQTPRKLYLLFKDLPEFQKSDFNNFDLFRRRLYSLRHHVWDGKLEATKDRLMLENFLADHPIPNKRLFVDIALPMLRIDMDAGKHLTMAPRELHKTRPEYLEFALNKFRGHIHQEVYTRKACVQYKWKRSPNIGDLPKPEVLDFDEDDMEEDEGDN